MSVEQVFRTILVESRNKCFVVFYKESRSCNSVFFPTKSGWRDFVSAPVTVLALEQCCAVHNFAVFCLAVSRNNNNNRISVYSFKPSTSVNCGLESVKHGQSVDEVSVCSKIICCCVSTELNCCVEVLCNFTTVAGNFISCCNAFNGFLSSYICGQACFVKCSIGYNSVSINSNRCLTYVAIAVYKTVSNIFACSSGSLSNLVHCTLSIVYCCKNAFSICSCVYCCFTVCNCLLKSSPAICSVIRLCKIFSVIVDFCLTGSLNFLKSISCGSGRLASSQHYCQSQNKNNDKTQNLCLFHVFTFLLKYCL